MHINISKRESKGRRKQPIRFPKRKRGEWMIMKKKNLILAATAAAMIAAMTGCSGGAEETTAAETTAAETTAAETEAEETEAEETTAAEETEAAGEENGQRPPVPPGGRGGPAGQRPGGVPADRGGPVRPARPAGGRRGDHRLHHGGVRPSAPGRGRGGGLGADPGPGPEKMNHMGAGKPWKNGEIIVENRRGTRYNEN